MSRPVRRGAGKRGEMTPQELERLGIAITGTTNWIAPLAKVMGLGQPSVVRRWWTGKTRITAPKQRKLLLLAGQPDAPLAPIFDNTRFQLTRIMAMREQGCSYKLIGQELGVSPQAVEEKVRRYRRVKPVAELGQRQCVVCSETFQPKTRGHVCCSRRCREARWRSLHRRLTPRDPKSCLECQAMFQPRDLKAKYCSRRCCRNHCARQYRQRLRARPAA
jgi:hypothetical protein